MSPGFTPAGTARGRRPIGGSGRVSNATMRRGDLGGRPVLAGRPARTRNAVPRPVPVVTRTAGRSARTVHPVSSSAVRTDRFARGRSPAAVVTPRRPAGTARRRWLWQRPTFFRKPIFFWNGTTRTVRSRPVARPVPRRVYVIRATVTAAVSILALAILLAILL